MEDLENTDVDISQYQTQLTLTLDPKEVYPFVSMFIGGYPDVFCNEYIGYWAFGAEFFEEDNSWLCIQDPEEIPLDMNEFEIAIDAAIQKYKELKESNWDGCEKKIWEMEIEENNKTKKITCFVIDPSLACRAATEAYRKWGKESVDNWDANKIDFGMQMALYGQMKWTNIT